jgi:Protein of unknown function (DUF2782)
MRRYILLALLYFPTLAAAEATHARELAIIPEPPQVGQKVQSGQILAPDPTVVNEKSEPPPQAVPEQPDLPLPVQSGETLQPDITIIRGNKKTLQEYRHNGEVYMVKVIPDVGPAYYLIDTNGDGKLDVRGSDLDKGLQINMWNLLEWN